MLEIFLLWYGLQPINLAEQAVNNKQYDNAIQLLEQISPDGNKYAYLMAVSNFQLNNKDEAEKWLLNVSQRFTYTGPSARVALFEPDKPAATNNQVVLPASTELSERHNTVINLMLTDIQQWRLVDEQNPNKPDVANLARKMKAVAGKLEIGRGGPETQERQQDIKEDLDKLIKAVEDEAKKQAEQNASGQGDGKDKQGQKSTTPVGGVTPQQNTIGGLDSGAGKVDQKKLQNLAQNWGKLQEKQRASALMDLVKDLPPRYREIIENYFKALSIGK